jgi:hypothetical protein
MSKKNQRKVSETSASTERKAPLSGRPSLSSEFNPDYTLIIRDLKWTGILAGAFIGILVILTFFLR